MGICDWPIAGYTSRIQKPPSPCAVAATAATAAATLEGDGEEEDERPSKKQRVSGRERRVPEKFQPP